MTNPVNERLEPQSFCEIQLNPQVAFAESEVSVTITVTVFGNFLWNEGGWISWFVSREDQQRLQVSRVFSGLQDWGSELTVAMAEGKTHV